MYSDEAQDAAPSSTTTTTATNIVPLYSAFKELVKGYVGLKGASSPRDNLFACPADACYPNFVSAKAVPPWQYVQASLRSLPAFNYSSYVFNGGDNKTRASDAGP
jgi:hypothetical protein